MMRGDDTLLDAATSLIPLSQGKLDSLCGLYSVLNAIQLISWPVLEHRHYRSRQLFNRGISFLDEEERLCSTLISGMDETTWHDLTEVLVDAASTLSGIKLCLAPLIEDWMKVSKSQFVALIERHTDAGEPVLIAMHGGYNHYTVIVAVRQHRLILFDSYGYRWVSLDSCQLDRGKRRKRHRLRHRSAVALKRS